MSSSSSESSSSASICCDLFTRNPVLADRRRVAGQARAAVVGAAAGPELKSRNHVAKLTGASAAWAVVLCRSISSVHAAHGSERHRGLQRRRPWQLPLRHLPRFFNNIFRFVITYKAGSKGLLQIWLKGWLQIIYFFSPGPSGWLHLIFLARHDKKSRARRIRRAR